MIASGARTGARRGNNWLALALAVSLLLTLLPVTAARAAAPGTSGTSVASELDGVSPVDLDLAEPLSYSVTVISDSESPQGFTNDGRVLLQDGSIWQNGSIVDDISDDGANDVIMPSIPYYASWLNNQGQAVMRSSTVHQYVLRDSDGTITPIDGFPTGFNDAGQVPLRAVDDNSTKQAYLWANGNASYLGTGWPHDLSTDGTVVGYDYVSSGSGLVQGARLWDGGTVVDLHQPSWAGSQAELINDAGDVVGWFALPTESSAAGIFHYKDGVVTELPVFADEEGTRVHLFSINTAGQFVGTDPRGNPDTNSGSRGYLYDLQAGTLTYLSDVITDPSYEIEDGLYINDAGQIVASAYNKTIGNTAYVLLEPAGECPLPPAPISMASSKSLAATSKQPVNGQVFWNPSVSGSSSVPVPGARIQIGCGVDEQTDETGNYALSAEPGEQTMTASLDLFSHAPTGASVTIVETMQVTVPEDGGDLPAMTTFGKNMRLTVMGKDTPLLNVKGIQNAFTAEADIPVNIEGTEVPIHVNVSWTKDPDVLKISANTGTFQWQGQTLTITDFKYESPANTFTFKATGSFLIGGLQVNNVQLTATRDENGVFHFDGTGQVLVQGATIAFESIKAKSGSATELHVRAKVTLPNQPANSFATFETNITPGGSSLNVVLQNFTFNGVVATAQLHYTSSPQKLSVTGTAKSQIGGAQLDAAIDTTIASGNSTVAAKVTLSLASNGGDPISIQADIVWNATTNHLTGTATASFPITPCPGISPGVPAPSYVVQVQLAISTSSIAINGSASIPLPCSFGANKSMTITVSAANQDLSVNATIPFTVQGLSGDLAAEFKVSDSDTRVVVGVRLNVNLSFLNLNLQQKSLTEHEPGGPQLQVAAGTVRMAVVDPLGLRTGYDPATGNGVTEIPGATWSLGPDGLDQINVPGFLGGYRVELYSTVTQTVIVTIQGDNGTSASLTADLVANEPHYGHFGLSVDANGLPGLGAGVLSETSAIDVTYTGMTLVPGAPGGMLWRRNDSPNTVLLAATLSEPADGTVGDVREATVRFVNRATGETLCTAPVGLVEPTNTRLGTAACYVQGALGRDSTSITVGIVVEGAYTRDDADDDQTITLAGPQSGGASFTATMTEPAPTGQLLEDGPATLSLSASASPSYSEMALTAQQGSSRYIIQPLTRTSYIRTGSQVSVTGRVTVLDVSRRDGAVVVTDDAMVHLTATMTSARATAIALTVWHPDGGIILATNWDGVRSAETPLSTSPTQDR